MLQHTTSLTRLNAIALLTLSLTACASWVQLTPEGAEVDLVGDASVSYTHLTLPTTPYV